jgi:hypothetical protein
MSILNEVETLLGIGPSRSFGLTNQIFSGYVTLTENTIDEIEITDQPVQQGAAISDHAFKKPVVLSIQILFGTSIFTGGSLSAIYQNLLALQSSFTPFVVTTPKRVYSSMLFKALGVTTEKKTENILSINCSFKQIITVPIIVGTLSASQLKNRGSNASTQPVGQKQSALYTGGQALGIR